MHKSMQHIFATSFCAPQHAATPSHQPPPCPLAKPWQITIETVLQMTTIGGEGQGAWLVARFHGIAVNLWHTHKNLLCIHTRTHTLTQPPLLLLRLPIVLCRIRCSSSRGLGRRGGGLSWNWNKCFRDIYLHNFFGCIFYALFVYFPLLFMCSKPTRPTSSRSCSYSYSCHAS